MVAAPVALPLEWEDPRDGTVRQSDSGIARNDKNFGLVARISVDESQTVRAVDVSAAANVQRVTSAPCGQPIK
jgi:hypothetical protein